MTMSRFRIIFMKDWKDLSECSYSMEHHCRLHLRTIVSYSTVSFVIANLSCIAGKVSQPTFISVGCPVPLAPTVIPGTQYLVRTCPSLLLSLRTFSWGSRSFLKFSFEVFFRITHDGLSEKGSTRRPVEVRNLWLMFILWEILRTIYGNYWFSESLKWTSKDI